MFLLLLRSLKLSLLALLLAIGSVQAALTPVVVGDEPSLEFTSHAEIFVDASGALDAPAVAALGNQFHPVTPDDLKRRYDSRVFWLRATLQNASAD